MEYVSPLNHVLTEMDSTWIPHGVYVESMWIPCGMHLIFQFILKSDSKIQFHTNI